MRITLIHQYYLRQGQAGGSRFNAMARHWCEQGCEVTVLAGQVDYTDGFKPEFWRRRIAVREQDGPVEVWRLFTPDTYQRTYVGRAAAIASFGAISAAALAPLLRHTDVVIATSPPLTVALSSCLAGALTHTPTIFEVRDLWPESAVATGVLSADGWMTRQLYRLEALAMHTCDAAVALTPAIAEDLVARGLKEREDVHLLPNGADHDVLARGGDEVGRARLRRALGWDGAFVVLYAGSHGLANHLWQYLDAAALLQNREDIILASIGDGPEKPALMRATHQRGLTNVHWLDPVSHDEIGAYFEAADCGAAILKRTPTFRTVYPNKIFDAMAHRRPVLCAVDGAARQLIEEANAGLYAPPESPGELARAIRTLAAHPGRAAQMGQRGRALVEERFDRKKIAGRYLSLMRQLIHGR